jgi:CRISPR associated protein Cas1
MACHALGLDPGLGILHVDRENRDSLALDLLEAIRPDVDRHVLRMVFERTLRASDFHETRTGQCLRILPPLTHRLAEACYSLRRAIAPVAEHVAHALASNTERAISRRTPLTQANQARVRERIETASQERADSAMARPETRERVDDGIAQARCATCGSANVRQTDDLCLWCARSRTARAAWRARRASA